MKKILAVGIITVLLAFLFLGLVPSSLATPSDNVYIDDSNGSYATPEIYVAVTPSPTPVLEWIRTPGIPISGRDALQIVGGVVGCVFIVLLWQFLWNYNEKLKKW